jgi:hypothetical protein
MNGSYFAFFSTQYLHIPSAYCLSCAALKVRFFLVGAAGAEAAVVTAASAFFGGPRPALRRSLNDLYDPIKVSLVTESEE